jgi:hypothetical protein
MAVVAGVAAEAGAATETRRTCLGSFELEPGKAQLGEDAEFTRCK